MDHVHRAYTLKTGQTPEEVATEITEAYAWTLCSGWRVGNIALLNDSYSENSVQEYAAVLITEETDDTFSGIAIESLTVSWMEADKLAAEIRMYIGFTPADVPDDWTWQHPVTLKKHPQGRCNLCA